MPPPVPQRRPKQPGDFNEPTQFNTIIRRITQDPNEGDNQNLHMAPPGDFPPPTGDARGPLLPPPQEHSSQIQRGYEQSPDLAAALHQAKTPGQGMLVAFFGCKGGVGNTFNAINLASSLAQTHNVCLVDMDLQMGDVLVSMNMEGRCAISHLMREIQKEGSSLNPRTILDRHSSTGVYVLSQVQCLEELDLISSTEVGHLFAFLKNRFPFVVVDGLRGFDDHSMFILDSADTVLLVVNQDVPSIRSAARTIEIFRRVGFSDSKVAVLISEYHKKALITPQDISMSLKLDRIFTIRKDSNLALRSLNEGQPLQVMAPQSKLCRDINDMARAIPIKNSSQLMQIPKSKGLFSWLKKG